MSERLQRSSTSSTCAPTTVSSRSAAATATLVCERLTGGRLTAVDRSAKMIAAAAQRNAAHVADGTAEFLVAALERLDLGERRFDVVFAVRVGLFHREPERARSLVEPWLAPGGCVRAFFDPAVRRDA